MRRRRLDEIFDFAALVLQKNLRLILTLSAPMIVVCFAANCWLIFWFARFGADELEWLSWPHLALLFLLLFERSLISLPVLLLNGNLLFERRPRLRGILGNALRLYPRYLWSQAILAPLQIIVFSWTFVLPWRALVAHFFRGEVIALERLRGRDMTRRLDAMAAGQGERNVGFVILNALVFSLYLGAVAFGFNVVLGMASLSDHYWWLDADITLFSPVMHLFVLAYGVFHTTVKFLYYIDSRSLREGWDIELTIVKGVRETEEAA
ncbi:MAG: hypothetical protein RIF32_12510 [Leptospirales bacterium]